MALSLKVGAPLELTFMNGAYIHDNTECEDNLNSFNFDLSKIHFGHISLQGTLSDYG